MRKKFLFIISFLILLIFIIQCEKDKNSISFINGKWISLIGCVSPSRGVYIIDIYGSNLESVVNKPSWAAKISPLNNSVYYILENVSIPSVSKSFLYMNESELDKQVSEDGYYISDYEFFPDGSKIAATKDDDIYIIEIGTGNEILFSEIDWSNLINLTNGNGSNHF